MCTVYVNVEWSFEIQRIFFFSRVVIQSDLLPPNNSAVVQKAANKEPDGFCDI